MNRKEKHILFLPRWYPNRNDSMWGLFVRKHAEAASVLNKISVLYIDPLDETNKNEEWIEYEDDSIYTLYIYFKKPKSKISYLYRLIKIYFKALKFINSRARIDIVHAHILTRMGLLAYLSYKIKSIPFVVTEHWSRYLPSVKVYKGWLRKRLTELVVKNAKAMMPVTLNLKNAMQNHGIKNNNYKIIPNVVDDLFFASKRNPSEAKRIIHVSTFEDKSKNISGIIEAIQVLNQNRSDFKMVFIGDGMDFKRMVNKTKELALDERIEFTGLLEKEALVNEFEKANFLLINSNYENMPVVINEAMACGLPVLSTNVGGISEHLTPERGVLIEPNQPEQLVEQLNYMIDNSNRFDSSKIKQYALDHFSMKAIGKKLDLIYKDALTK